MEENRNQFHVSACQNGNTASEKGKKNANVNQHLHLTQCRLIIWITWQKSMPCAIKRFRNQSFS